MERRERNPDTGEVSYSGSGFYDVLAKIGTKLTGKTAKKLASKATEKVIEKGAEKIGEKTGEVIGEKIYNKFSLKPIHTEEMKGEEIETFEKRKYTKSW